MLKHYYFSDSGQENEHYSPVDFLFGKCRKKLWNKMFLTIRLNHVS